MNLWKPVAEYGGVKENCPLLAQVFVHLTPSWWCYLTFRKWSFVEWSPSLIGSLPFLPCSLPLPPVGGSSVIGPLPSPGMMTCSLYHDRLYSPGTGSQSKPIIFKLILVIVSYHSNRKLTNIKPKRMKSGLAAPRDTGTAKFLPAHPPTTTGRQKQVCNST